MNISNQFVTKIINKSQAQIIQRLKSLPKLLSVSLIAVLGLLPITSIPNRGILAYAQQIQLQTTATTDPWYQSLEVARSKVEAALSPGAFGHGVPGLVNLSTNEILMAFGVSVVAGIAVFMAVRVLTRYTNMERIGSKVSFLSNKMI